MFASGFRCKRSWSLWVIRLVSSNSITLILQWPCNWVYWGSFCKGYKEASFLTEQTEKVPKLSNANVNIDYCCTDKDSKHSVRYCCITISDFCQLNITGCFKVTIFLTERSHYWQATNVRLDGFFWIQAMIKSNVNSIHIRFLRLCHHNQLPHGALYFWWYLYYCILLCFIASLKKNPILLLLYFYFIHLFFFLTKFKNNWEFFFLLSAMLQ